MCLHLSEEITDDLGVFEGDCTLTLAVGDGHCSRKGVIRETKQVLQKLKVRLVVIFRSVATDNWRTSAGREVGYR